MKKGPKMNVFQLIWEVNGTKLSNMLNNDPSHAEQGRTRPKSVKKRPKWTRKRPIVQIRPKKGQKRLKMHPKMADSVPNGQK